MQWAAADNAGFTEGVPWLPVDASFRTRNVASEDADPTSLLNWYRALIRLRRASPALHLGSYRPIDGSHGLFAYERRSGDEAVAVLLNFRARRIRLPEGLSGAVVLSTHRGAGSPLPNALEGYEALLVAVSQPAARTPAPASPECGYTL